MHTFLDIGGGLEIRISNQVLGNQLSGVAVTIGHPLAAFFVETGVKGRQNHLF